MRADPKIPRRSPVRKISARPPPQRSAPKVDRADLRLRRFDQPEDAK